MKNSRIVPRILARLLVVAGLILSLPLAHGAQNETKGDRRQANYKLKPMDLLRIQVFQEMELDRELRISQEYKIVAPLIGVVDLRDCTVRDAERLIADLYRADFLVNPQINITVLEYAPRTVDVLGAVNNPGAVTIPAERDLTLLNAIARSGGFSRLANRNKVNLTRTFPDGQTITYTIDADKLMEGDPANRGLVRDGDLIFVPERLL